jgi:hypothetical protein
MKIPRALRVARSQTYGYQNPQRELDTFNRGFIGDPNANLPDALRGSVRLIGNQAANIEAIAQAAARGNHQRRG